MDPKPKRIRYSKDGDFRHGSAIHLVFDILIEWAINAGYLGWRSLRLVNRSWDESVCYHLRRKKSAVTIYECNEAETKNMLKLLRGRFPWKGEIRLVADTFSKPSFIAFLRDFLGKFPITEFTLRYDTRLCANFGSLFKKMLKLSSSTLTKLVIRRHSSAVEPKPFNLRKYSLSNLKEFEIDFNEELESVLEKIFSQNVKLEILAIQFLPDGITELPSSNFWELVKKVPSLRITFVSFERFGFGSDKNFPIKTLARVPLENLHKLNFFNVYRGCTEAEVEDAKEIFYQWSGSLEQIIFQHTNISFHGMPVVFAKLRRMVIAEKEACHFDPETLPSLEEIHLSYLPTLCEHWAPHLGVKTLEFRPGGKNVGGLEEFFESLLTLGKLFPNVEKFGCNQSNFSEDDARKVRKIKKVFLSLKFVTVGEIVYAL